MKKKTLAIIVAILAVALCFTLAACGDKTDADTGASQNDAVLDENVNATEGEDATDATDATDAQTKLPQLLKTLQESRQQVK